MKKLLLKISIFTITALFLFLVFISLYLIKYSSNIDSNYERLKYYHDEGLIIGTSRAAVCLEPSILNSDLYNFSFTIDASPYDNSYLELIKKYHRINRYDTDRIHIVTVDPWSLSSVLINEQLINNGFTSNLKFSVMDPEYEYIFKYANLTIWEILNVVMNHKRNPMVNRLGRLVKPLDEEFLNKDYYRKLSLKINNYKSNDLFNFGDLSPGKINNLKSVIEYLNKDGKVYVIRLPISKEMLELEDKMEPDFNKIIEKISLEMKVPYIDLMDWNSEFRTTDGHHIWENEVYRFNYSLERCLKSIVYKPGIVRIGPAKEYYEVKSVK